MCCGFPYPVYGPPHNVSGGYGYAFFVVLLVVLLVLGSRYWITI
ncbi:hypothetical protein P8907_06515 [Bacillus atrophaeus]|nr:MULTISPECIES: hypothetical protein [Bacillus]KYD02034.1 hypothetical protein B4144_2520 [Bacillus atrophaeus]MEC0765114.1 hypothetical protein [Bacillus atrophaeus]MEC0778215.1 hypothetical protein [Bacillus atrophaeus]MEC0808251.1 hypothetical protein [Bacillus atrophaeus]MEC0837692.1 hypothetical protein [Bacillus atrophaeus]